MSTQQTGQASFPLRSAIGAGLAVAMFPVAMLLALKLFSLASAAALMASAMLAGVNFLVAAAVLAMVAMIASHGPLAVMAAFLGGGFVRFIANVLVVGVIAVALPLSYVWLMVLLALAYLPLLALETSIVGRFLWGMDAAAATGSGDAASSQATAAHEATHDMMKPTEAVA